LGVEGKYDVRARQEKHTSKTTSPKEHVCSAHGHVVQDVSARHAGKA
jgi:hypothetical protein